MHTRCRLALSEWRLCCHVSMNWLSVGTGCWYELAVGMNWLSVGTVCWYELAMGRNCLLV